jgi:LPS export ABC transporter protein LptC
MTRALRTISLFVALLGLAILSWIYARPQTTAPGEDRNPTSIGRAYLLRNAVLLGTDDSGRVYYRVFAETVEKSPVNDDLVLDKVRVEYEADTEVQWRLSANQGRATGERNIIDLMQDVRLSSTNPDSSSAMVAETEELRLNVEESTASTEQLVAILHGNTRFEATGFEANLKSDYLRLHSNVSIHFAR